MNSKPWKMSRTQQPNRRTRLNFLAEPQKSNYFLQIIIHSNTTLTLCAFCAYNLIINKNLPNCCCYMKRPTMLRPMKRCKQRTNLWLGHSTWRIRFWFAWKATIVFRPQDRQKKAAGHIQLPGSFVVRVAREGTNIEVKGKVNEIFSRVSPILRLRPFLRNCLTTTIPQLVFHVGKICTCYLFFLVSCQGFCARLCSRCVPSTIWFSAVLFLWCCEGIFWCVGGCGGQELTLPWRRWTQSWPLSRSLRRTVCALWIDATSLTAKVCSAEPIPSRGHNVPRDLTYILLLYFAAIGYITQIRPCAD
jgi:hypothetical protein